MGMPGVKNWIALHMRYRRALPPRAEKYVQLYLRTPTCQPEMSTGSHLVGSPNEQLGQGPQAANTALLCSLQVTGGANIAQA